MSYLLFINFIFILIISGSWCQPTEQIVAEIGEPFSFDCKQDESVYFGRRLDELSEIQENDDKYSYLNLKFNYLTNENILRITSNSAQSQNVGYYGCRKPTWETTSMNRIYQLSLADVQSFYWTYICHGPTGSCIRSDDPTDETQSTFEVADETSVDLFCCASLTGYKNININMNPVGEIRGKIHVKRKQELDGSWVVCANQHTVLKRTSSRNQQTLTCELITDNRIYSSLSSAIVMKDAMLADPDIDPPYGYTPPPRSDDEDYFNRQPLAGGKLMTGKKVAILIGSIIGGLFLLGLLFCLIFFQCRKKKALKNSKTNKSTDYSVVNTNKKSNKADEQSPKEEESVYLQPTPLYQNIPVVLRH